MDDSLFEDLSQFQEEFRSYGALSWRTCLGIAALLDFLATVLSRQLRVSNPELDQTMDQFLPESMQGGEEEYQFFGQHISDVPFGVILRFLHHNSGYIGLIFSSLCLAEAFMDASRHRDRALMERDRQRLLRIYKDENDEDSINVIDDLGYLDDNIDSWMAFYFRLFIQLMCLPLGFYWLMSKGIFLEAQMDIEGHADQGDRELKEVLRDTYSVNHSDNNLSLGFSIVKNIVGAIMGYAYAKGLVAKRAIFKEVKHYIRKCFGKAIRNPRKFASNLRKILTVLRWVKYLQPIIGATNKLKGNLADLTKKFRQRQKAKIMRKIRRKLFHEMSETERRDYAARKIQSVFRGHQTRRAMRAMNILRGNKEAMAAMKLQKAFKAKLLKARGRIAHKKLEFERLRLKSELAMGQKNKKEQLAEMTPKERRRLYELEEELQLETARLLSQRMLIKPTTKFSVAWKILFCVCILFEITGLLWNPKLKKIKDETTGDALSVHSVVGGYFMPVPISEIPECSCPEVAQNWKSKLILALQRQPPVTCEPGPWFCHPPFSTARASYISIVELFIDEFLLLVGLVVFLDVPISFLTGEIDDETGVLRPKPFFKRWILPGLLLQLLVNPKMAPTSKALWGILQKIFDIGPVRVFRWTSAFIYPLFLFLFDFTERRIWAPFVYEQNHKSIFAEVKSRVVQKHKDLEDSMEKLSSI